MNLFKLLLSKAEGSSATPEQIEDIINKVETITSSNLAYEKGNDNLIIRGYIDDLFSIVKTVMFYPNGTKEIGYGIILSNDTQVFDGRNAIKLGVWYDHLHEVYREAKNYMPKKLKYKK